MGHGLIISMLATAVGDERCLWDSGTPGSDLASSACSNSPIIRNYPAVNDIYMPVPTVKDPVEKRHYP